MGSKRRQKLHVQLLAYTLLQPKTPQWDIVLDLTRLAYQPQSCERSTHPKRHVSALSEQKSAYLAHTRELDEDGDDKRLVRPDRPTVSADEDDQPLVQPAWRKELVEEKRQSARAPQSSCTCTKRKRTSSLARSIYHTGAWCVWRLAWAIRRILDFVAENQTVKLSAAS